MENVFWFENSYFENVFGFENSYLENVFGYESSVTFAPGIPIEWINIEKK